MARCLEDVTSLRIDLSSARDRTVTHSELVPIMDGRRAEMRILGEVLGRVEEVADVKGTVPVLIGAGDYAGAVGAIRRARGLRRGEDGAGERGGFGEEKGEDREDRGDGGRAPLALGGLDALSKVDAQLSEYERLVVLDLSTDLVGTFLSWNGGGGVGVGVGAD